MGKYIYGLLKKIENGEKLNDDREIRIHPEINKKDFATCRWLENEKDKLIECRHEPERHDKQTTGNIMVIYAKLTSAGEKYLMDYEISQTQIRQSRIVMVILIASFLLNIIQFLYNNPVCRSLK